MDIAEQKLMAARLLLGDNLAKELVDDQWNAVNELTDPYEVRGNTSRYNMNAAQFAAKILHAVTEGLKGPAMELGARRQAAIGAMPDEEREAWFKGGETPASYTNETCADFEGPDPESFIAGLVDELDHKTALLEGRFEDTRFVSFEGGQLSVQGSVVPVIVETLAQSLGHREPGMEVANYVEIAVDHRDLGELTVTLQRKSGKTPHQLRREAEEKLAAAMSGNQDEKSPAQ